MCQGCWSKARTRIWRASGLPSITRFALRVTRHPLGVRANSHRLAETRHTTASRVLVDLIETGLQTKQAQHDRFFELTDRLAEASDPAERKRLQEELARISCCK